MERYNNSITDSSGNISTTATVTVYLSSSGAPASIFLDDETTAINNPFTIDDTNYGADGRFWFKAANALYNIKVVDGDTSWTYDENLFDYDDPVSLTFTTITVTADTSAGDNATMGYTSTEGLILTGQGSTNDVTIKNDADNRVISIPTGTLNVGLGGQAAALYDLDIQQNATDIAVRIGTSTTNSYDFGRNNASGYLTYTGNQNTYSGYRWVTTLGTALTIKNNGDLVLSNTTEDLIFVDAGSTSATEQDWITVTVGGTTGYIRVFATK